MVKGTKFARADYEIVITIPAAYCDGMAWIVLGNNSTHYIVAWVLLLGDERPDDVCTFHASFRYHESWRAAYCKAVQMCANLATGQIV